MGKPEEDMKNFGYGAAVTLGIVSILLIINVVLSSIIIKTDSSKIFKDNVFILFIVTGIIAIGAMIVAYFAWDKIHNSSTIYDRVKDAADKKRREAAAAAAAAEKAKAAAAASKTAQPGTVTTRDALHGNNDALHGSTIASQQSLASQNAQKAKLQANQDAHAKTKI